MANLVDKIKLKIESDSKCYQAYEDLFYTLLEMEDKRKSHEINKYLREKLIDEIKEIREQGESIGNWFNLYKKTLLYDADVDFDSYMLYIEIDRNPSERFYQPRRRQLKEIVKALQELADDELDELFISQPPRTGKTSILMFYVTWLIGRNSESSNLYSAYSDTITKAFYNGVLEVITDKHTYLWGDVFPAREIVQTNSQDETLNLDRKKRYPSLTCRSLYGTLNGACDCNGILITDDLIGGIEEALNKDRMMNAWFKVDNNLIPRAKEKAKLLWCGTRWSMIDPAGLRMETITNDERFKNRRFKIINVPALNENDESNFTYSYGVGFSTEYYHQRRASFERNNDMASWLAQYQGQPIERDGALFSPEDLRYYNGELPSEQPDRVFMAVDPAFGGGDFVASPICYQYGDDIYVVDVVYSNAEKTITQPLLCNAIIRNNVTRIEVEANKSTEAYKEGIESILKDKEYKINITSKCAPNNKSKEQRIFDKAPDIRSMMIFLENGKRSKEYNLFMQNVYAFKITGKNKHDDAPDSLAMAISMVLGREDRKAVVFNRPF